MLDFSRNQLNHSIISEKQEREKEELMNKVEFLENEMANMEENYRSQID